MYYYHIIIESKETQGIGKGKENIKYFELNKTDLTEIKEKIITPLLNNRDFLFTKKFLNKSDVKKIQITRTLDKAEDISDAATTKYKNSVDEETYLFMRRNFPSQYSAYNVILMKEYAEDITDNIINGLSIPQNNPTKTVENNNLSKVFIVHGRDDLAKTVTARFIEQLGLTAIILHEQASSGKTIIEKIEEHADVGFSIVLYTPCDIGGLDDKNLKSRARQNVVFEHGYLIGRLGRQKVCALIKGDIETPNDISGIVYIPLDDHGAWHLSVAREIRKAGYTIDMNKII